MMNTERSVISCKHPPQFPFKKGGLSAFLSFFNGIVSSLDQGSLGACPTTSQDMKFVILSEAKNLMIKDRYKARFFGLRLRMTCLLIRKAFL